MATRNVVLPDPLEQDINELVETGRYQNRSEVIRAGLRLLLQQEAQNSAKLGLYAGIPEISVSPAPVPPRAHPGR
ncbi:TPA: type II toxin-antitoxin system ParD family antitoxin [Pseudomonas aeruginosa]|nr:type II toxin-antitoxin system ParD family antitoxin [Pseudomonas aeruginosa]